MMYVMPYSCVYAPVTSWAEDTDKRRCWSKYIVQGACPCLPTTTVVGPVMVPRSQPLPQFLGNVVERHAQVGKNATS